MKKIILLLAVFVSCLTPSFGQKKGADTIAALIDGNSPMEKLFINMGIKKNKKSKNTANKNVVREKSKEDTIRVFIRYDSLGGTKYLVEIYLSPNNSSLTPGTDINVGIGGGLDAGIVIVSVDSLKSSNGKLEIACIKNKDFNDLVSIKIYYAPREKANETYVLYRKLLSVPKKG